MTNQYVVLFFLASDEGRNAPAPLM
jgi:hypothetical protein